MDAVQAQVAFFLTNKTKQCIILQVTVKFRINIYVALTNRSNRHKVLCKLTQKIWRCRTDCWHKRSEGAGQIVSCRLEGEGTTKMRLNFKKTKPEMVIDLCNKKSEIPMIRIDNTAIERTTSHKLLGIWIESDLKWNNNTCSIIKKGRKRLYFLKVLMKYGAPAKDLSFYCSVIQFVVEYGDILWHGDPITEPWRWKNSKARTQNCSAFKIRGSINNIQTDFLKRKTGKALCKTN